MRCADDNVPYFYDGNFKVLLNKYQLYVLKPREWFSNNCMRMNSDKHHPIISSNDKNKKIELTGVVIKNSQIQKCFGIHTNYKLKFQKNIEPLCKEVTRKLHELAKFIKYTSTQQKIFLHYKNFNENFYHVSISCYPLVWIYNIRKLNKQINELHKHTFRLGYNDGSSSFRELLEKEKSVPIHGRNVEVLWTKIFKLKGRLAQEIMTEAFRFKTTDHMI